MLDKCSSWPPWANAAVTDDYCPPWADAVITDDGTWVGVTFECPTSDPVVEYRTEGEAADGD